MESGRAEDTVLYVRCRSGKDALLAGYHINSNDLITN